MNLIRHEPWAAICSFNAFLSNVLRKSGYYFSEVEVQKKVNSNNTLNIIYDIKMGEKALISEIKFIGDKKFKSSKLRSVIRSEENKFYGAQYTRGILS